MSEADATVLRGDAESNPYYGEGLDDAAGHAIGVLRDVHDLTTALRLLGRDSVPIDDRTALGRVLAGCLGRLSDDIGRAAAIVRAASPIEF